MNQPEWVPEPWEATGVLIHNKSGKEWVASTNSDDSKHCRANATRIVSCINAFASIPYPDEFVKAAKVLLDCCLALDENYLRTVYECGPLEKAIARLTKATNGA